jgi:hypothetical protein
MNTDFVIGSDAIKHNFFKSYTHFINYCFKICQNNEVVFYEKDGVCMDDEDIKDIFRTYAWSVEYENRFKRIGVIPPYALLIWSLKQHDHGKQLKSFINSTYDELSDIKSGVRTIEQCPNLVQKPIDESKGVLKRYTNECFTAEYIELLDEASGKCGLYKLYDTKQKLVYVGKSYDLASRIPSSSKTRNSRYVSVCYTKSQSDANLLEVYFISKEKPSENADAHTIDALTIKVSHTYKFSPLIRIFKDENDVIPAKV